VVFINILYIRINIEDKLVVLINADWPLTFKIYVSHCVIVKVRQIMQCVLFFSGLSSLVSRTNRTDVGGESINNEF